MDFSELSAASAEVGNLQARLSGLQATKRQLSLTYATAISKRPPGIPDTWLPDFSGSGPNLTINAWFDPKHFGTSIFSH